MPTPCDEQDAELFVASTTVTIRDGRKALFWESPWVFSSPLKTMASNLYRHARRKKRTVANALQDNKWIDDIRHNLTSVLVTEFFKVFEILWESNTTLFQGVQDSIQWKWTPTGSYTAKSTYQMQSLGSIPSLSATAVWKCWAPSKSNFFAWLLLQNRIWTADRL